MNFNNQYLTFNEYKEMGGNLAEMPFNILEFKSRKLIDINTLGRLTELQTQVQEVKMCVYELIKAVEINEKSPSQGKTSESIDGYSVTYANNSAKEQTRQYRDIIMNYLINCRLDDGTPYLYLGV